MTKVMVSRNQKRRGGISAIVTMILIIKDSNKIMYFNTQITYTCIHTTTTLYVTIKCVMSIAIMLTITTISYAASASSSDFLFQQQ